MLELLCPDGSALLVDESKTIGRASGEGGLKDVPQASRAHFSVAPIALLEGALSLKMVGQNSLILEREEGIQWEFAGLLEAGQDAVLKSGHRFFIDGRQTTTTFLIRQHVSPAPSLQPTLAEPDQDDLAAMIASALADSAADVLQPPAKRMRHSGLSSQVPRASQHGQPMKGGFCLLHVQGLQDTANRGMLGASLSDLLQGDMQWVLVSNYMVDMAWLLHACPGLLSAKQLIVVHGEKGHSGLNIRAQNIKATLQHAGLGHATVFLPWLSDWGCHHSKFFLVQYPTGLRVIITTANMIQCDCSSKSQGIWWQDFPRRDDQSPPDSPFHSDLRDYVRALRLYKAERHLEKDALAILQAHDFSSARATIIASVPTTHEGSLLHKWGHMKLRKSLSAANIGPVFKSAPLVVQCSSMGRLDSKWLEEFAESCCSGCRPTVSPAQPTPSRGKRQSSAHEPGALTQRLMQFVWPTVAEVSASIEGWRAGASIPGTLANVNKPFLQHIRYRWGGEPAGRQGALPHIKSYLRYQADGRGSAQLPWAVMTSHNLSKAAWGKLQVNGSQLHICHYEMGVLLLPALEAAHRSHRHFGFSCTCHEAGVTIQQVDTDHALTFEASDNLLQLASSPTQDAAVLHLPIPYRLPPMPYSSPGMEDKPWAVDCICTGMDCHGCTSYSECMSDMSMYVGQLVD